MQALHEHSGIAKPVCEQIVISTSLTTKPGTRRGNSNPAGGWKIRK
jgi:hypothetical protein